MTTEDIVTEVVEEELDSEAVIDNLENVVLYLKGNEHT